MAYELTEQRKYELYEAAVQAPDYDVRFFLKEYKKLRKKTPTILREDFCGTGYLSCTWVKKNKDHKAIGLDLDPAPIAYGKQNHYVKLPKDAQKRMEYHECNVLESKKYKADIVAALNFSYCLFNKRADLKAYFAQVKASLKADGLFIMDLFGGTECMGPIEDIVEHDKFTYYWDCDDFNPITSECIYKIHFREKGRRDKLKDVFVYNWRLWSIAEVSDILTEVGFKDVKVYWEEDGDDGSGNGVFYSTKKATNCEAWIVYIVGVL